MIFKRLTSYKDLLLVFIWRDFSVRYRQTSIGILWAIVQPLSMMLMFTFIFSFVLKVKIADYPHVIFFYSGLLPWVFFSTSLHYAIPSLTNQYSLITKIYFPREIIPLSGIFLALIDYCIAVIFLGVLLYIYNIHLTWAALWFFPLIFLLFIFTVATSLILSSLNVYYRDVKLATGFVIQLWFFASPIMYSVDKIEHKLKALVFLNPLTFIIENMRGCLVEGKQVILWQYVLASTIIIFYAVFAYKYFVKMEREFSDVI